MRLECRLIECMYVCRVMEADAEGVFAEKGAEFEKSIPGVTPVRSQTDRSLPSDASATARKYIASSRSALNLDIMNLS